MAELNTKTPTSIDPIWQQMRGDAEATAAREPALASLLHGVILNHDSLEDALCYKLSQKLDSSEFSALELQLILSEAMRADPSIGQAVRADLSATYERDPACTGYIEPFLYFKGFHALQGYRVAHHLWSTNRRYLAMLIQSIISEKLAVDIHPAALIGKGIMIDHASGVVVGETAVIEDGVSLLHGVTLGGTGKEGGDRHPKVRAGTMIGAGAIILGNIEIGRCSRVGAGSVVLEDVPENTTVAGVPAKIVGEAGCDQPALSMEQHFDPQI